MRRIVWSMLLLWPLLAQASMLDFWHLKRADEAYKKGDYATAAREFSQVERKSDQVRYDLANTYYRLKRYKEAKALYEQIHDRALAFRKWHNIGNCEANLGHIDAGIKAYERALKIKEDKDTRYNLELLKKRKQQKKRNKKEQHKSQKNKQEQKNKQNSQNGQNQKSGQKRNNQNQKQQKQKSEGAQKSSADKEHKKGEQPKKGRPQEQKPHQNKSSEKGHDTKRNKEAPKGLSKPHQTAPNRPKAAPQTPQKADAAALKQAAKKVPISDKEVRKYLQMLDRRGVNTLMVPLTTKGEDHEELKPW